MTQVQQEDRGKFNHFLEKLKLATSAVRQTKNVLSNPAKPRPPKRKAANQALYRVLCSRTEQYVRTQLNQLTEATGSRRWISSRPNCYEKLYADQNDLDYQQHAINAFNTSTSQGRRNNIFLQQKIRLSLPQCIAACGIKMTDEEQAQIYLRALRLHRDPRILYEVKSQYEKLEKGRSKGLTEIQRVLLHEEELGQSQDYTVRPATRRDPRSRPTAQVNNITRQHKKAMATQSNKIHNSKRTSLGPCHGCGKQGHLLRDCKTTSEADKKRIWDMIRSSKHTANLPVREASKPVPNIKTAHPSAMETYASKVRGHANPNNSSEASKLKAVVKASTAALAKSDKRRFNQEGTATLTSHSHQWPKYPKGSKPTLQWQKSQVNHQSRATYKIHSMSIHHHCMKTKF